MYRQHPSFNCYPASDLQITRSVFEEITDISFADRSGRVVSFADRGTLRFGARDNKIELIVYNPSPLRRTIPQDEELAVEYSLAVYPAHGHSIFLKADRTYREDTRYDQIILRR